MKKLLTITSFLFIIFSFYPNSINAKVKKKKITITCPSGDKYTCYDPEDGPPVTKGEGSTTIVIEM